MQIFKLENISYTYESESPYSIIEKCEKTFSLKNVSLEINKQDFIGIVGKTGSGKSSLIQIIASLLKPTSGEMFFKGKNFNEKSFDKENFRKQIGFTFQFPEIQLFESTVEKEIQFGLKNFKFPKKEIPLMTKEILTRFGFDFDTIKGTSPLALSEGQKRKIALASVLACKPEVLILDEPFSNLDSKGILELTTLLKELNQGGTTIIIVSHDMDILAEISNRIIAMKEGEIVYDGSTLEFFTSFSLTDDKSFASCSTSILAAAIREQGLFECNATCKYSDLLHQIIRSLKK